MAAQPKRKALSSDAAVQSLLLPLHTFVIIGRENKRALASTDLLSVLLGNNARQCASSASTSIGQIQTVCATKLRGDGEPSLISALRQPTISGGVFAAALTPNQMLASKRPLNEKPLQANPRVSGAAPE